MLPLLLICCCCITDSDSLRPSCFSMKHNHVFTCQIGMVCNPLACVCSFIIIHRQCCLSYVSGFSVSYLWWEASACVCNKGVHWSPRIFSFMAILNGPLSHNLQQRINNLVCTFHSLFIATMYYHRHFFFQIHFFCSFYWSTTPLSHLSEVSGPCF